MSGCPLLDWPWVEGTRPVRHHGNQQPHYFQCTEPRKKTQRIPSPNLYCECVCVCVCVCGKAALWHERQSSYQPGGSRGQHLITPELHPTPYKPTETSARSFHSNCDSSGDWNDPTQRGYVCVCVCAGMCVYHIWWDSVNLLSKPHKICWHCFTELATPAHTHSFNA